MFKSSQEKNEPYVYEQYVKKASMELSLKDQERFKDRLREEKERRGIDLQKDFAKLLGITPTYLSYILGGKRIGFRKVVEFAKNLKVSVGYLLGVEELEPQWTIQPIITLLGNPVEIPPWLKPEDYYAVPMVEDRIAAGTGRIVSDEISSLVWVYKPEIGNRRGLVAVKLSKDADSMEPTLRPCDIVVIDKQDKTISHNGIYAVRTSPEPCAIKRITIAKDNFFLISDNPKYPPKISEFKNTEELIIGRVVWSWTSWIK